MNGSAPPVGRVASLHLHPPTSGGPLQSVLSMELSAGEGVVGDSRYFKRRSRDPNKVFRRHITLIEREQIGSHAATLGLERIEPGQVRSNVETLGIDLVPYVGSRLKIGDTAIVSVYEPREPCQQMDDLAPGLRELMRPNRQGVIAEVVTSGVVNIGDPIVPLTEIQH